MTLASILYGKLAQNYWEASRNGGIGKIYEAYWRLKDDLFIIEGRMKHELDRIEEDFRMKVPDSNEKVEEA
jgi:hypothetical protein